MSIKPVMMRLSGSDLLLAADAHIRTTEKGERFCYSAQFMIICGEYQNYFCQKGAWEKTTEQLTPPCNRDTFHLLNTRTESRALP